jgi:hypothetical protein
LRTPLKGAAYRKTIAKLQQGIRASLYTFRVSLHVPCFPLAAFVPRDDFDRKREQRRHPLEVNLPLSAWVELWAMDELLNPEKED